MKWLERFQPKPFHLYLELRSTFTTLAESNYVLINISADGITSDCAAGKSDDRPSDGSRKCDRWSSADDAGYGNTIANPNRGTTKASGDNGT
jgi:hypothetical protein